MQCTEFAVLQGVAKFERQTSGSPRISERVSRKKKSERTLARFEGGAVNGVPSRFSVTLCFATVSSLSGRMFRSAYFLQLMPQLSQSMLVARPFGAFHHVSDSLVRQAPQLI